MKYPKSMSPQLNDNKSQKISYKNRIQQQFNMPRKNKMKPSLLSKAQKKKKKRKQEKKEKKKIRLTTQGHLNNLTHQKESDNSEG